MQPIDQCLTATTLATSRTQGTRIFSHRINPVTTTPIMSLPNYEDNPSVRTSPSNASRHHQRTHHIVIASQPPATLESVTRCLTRSAICPPRSYHHQTALSPMSAMTYLGLCISIEPTFAAILIFIYIVYSRGTRRHLQIEDSQVEIFSALTLLTLSLHIESKIDPHIEPTYKLRHCFLSQTTPTGLGRNLPHIGDNKNIARGGLPAPAI